MNQYPEQYPMDSPAYSPSQYQPMFWQEAFSAIIGIAILVALGAWAFSLVKKAIKGEEVEFPL